MSIELFLPESEWLEWSRAAQKARLELPTWVRVLVNEARVPAPWPEPAAPREEREALHWEDEAGYAASCGYCGFRLEYGATRRKRYCSDRCRVKAWRVLKRRTT